MSAPHTDRATEYLIQCLVVNRWTVEAAVDATMEEIGPDLAYVSQQGYNTTLKYYPPAEGNFAIPTPTIVSSFSYRIFGSAVILMKDEPKASLSI